MTYRSHILLLLLLLGLAFSMACGSEEPPVVIDEAPPLDPIEQARLLVEPRLEILDDYLTELAVTMAVDEAIETLVESEAARPFQARVDRGLRYSTVYQREYVGGEFSAHFADRQGLTEAGESVLEVLRDAWTHSIDPEPLQLALIEDLLLRLNGADDLPDPALQPTPSELQALLQIISAELSLVEDPSDSTIEAVEDLMRQILFDVAKDPDAHPELYRWTQRTRELVQAAEPRARRIAELELYVADGALRYAREMRHANLNRLDWRDLRDAGGSTEVILSRMQDTLRALHAATSAPEVYEVFRDLEPSHAQYQGLLQAAARYRTIVDDGGWQRVATFSLDRARPAQVMALRDRLQAEGYQAYPDLDALRQAHREAHLHALRLIRDAQVAQAAQAARAVEVDEPSEEPSEVSSEEPSEASSPEPEPDPEPLDDQIPPFDEQAYLGAVDDTLIQAIRHYQRTHQFPDTGEPGPAFWRSLNLSAEERLAQIEVTLERWRETHLDGDRDYILVNIPDFHAEVVLGGERKMRFPVVVGRNNRICDRDTRQWDYPNATPILMSKMDHMIVNPSWYVPPRLVREAIDPRRRSEPDFFEREGYQEVRMADGRTVVRQNPGPSNALGRVKFMFPNEHNVYLHDTPQQQYFERSLRTFSFGCVRVSQPLALAELLLQREGRDDLVLDDMLESARTRVIHFAEPLPVIIEYYTVWIDDEGFPTFLSDPYRKDALRRAEDPDEFLSCRPQRPTPPAQEDDSDDGLLPLNLDVGP